MNKTIIKDGFVIKRIYNKKLAYRLYESRKILNEISNFINVPKTISIDIKDDYIEVINEFVEGQIMTDFTEKNSSSILDDLLELQLSINKITSKSNFSYKSIIINKIEKLNLDLSTFSDIDVLDGNHILHGDIQPNNIVIKDNKLIPIDWDNACVGNKNIDMIRTYCYLKLYFHDLSDEYLEKAKKKYNISEEEFNSILKYVNIELTL